MLHEIMPDFFIWQSGKQPIFFEKLKHTLYKDKYAKLIRHKDIYKHQTQ